VRLADLQSDIARSLVAGTIPTAAALFTGAGDPTRRFEIHSRHYAASLARSLVERFPATVWLVGSGFVTQAARTFVREHPPTRPCIAEYGEGFPAYLASGGGRTVPYLAQFAALDWQLGRLSIAADTPALRTLAACDPARLVDASPTLQSGTAYAALDWSLDELLRFYLGGDVPDQYALRHEAGWLELRGSRGELWFNRLPRPDYVFRSTLAAGGTLGRAAELAFQVDETFDAGQGLLAMLDAGLITGMPSSEGSESC
jgi:hypothetical protein